VLEKRAAEAQKRSTLAKDRAARDKDMYKDLKKMAYAKVAEFQNALDEYRVVKYLDGYKDGKAGVAEKHNLEELNVAEGEVNAAKGEGDSEESSSGGSGSDSSDGGTEVPEAEPVMPKKALPPSGATTTQGAPPAAESITAGRLPAKGSLRPRKCPPWTDPPLLRKLPPLVPLP
jgi:hypothetical protein